MKNELSEILKKANEARLAVGAVALEYKKEKPKVRDGALDLRLFFKS